MEWFSDIIHSMSDIKETINPLGVLVEGGLYGAAAVLGGVAILGIAHEPLLRGATLGGAAIVAALLGREVGKHNQPTVVN